MIIKNVNLFQADTDQQAIGNSQREKLKYLSTFFIQDFVIFVSNDFNRYHIK
jgi:hypothetical protein